jgi:16S rRNA processing protein RimM
MVGQPFGLEGFVKFRSFSGETAHLERLESMTLRKNGVEKGVRVVEIRPDVRPQKHGGGCSPAGRSLGGIILFEGVDDPEKAKALTGSEIVVSREDAAPLDEGEFYIEDLKGLRLVADKKTPGVEAGTVFGIVTGVFEGGGGMLLEVDVGDAVSNAKGGTRLVPFRDVFTGEISLEKGTIVLRAPWVLD